MWPHGLNQALARLGRRDAASVARQSLTPRRASKPNAKEKEKGVQIEEVAKTFRSRVTVPTIINTGFNKAKGNRFIAEAGGNAVAFGLPYIANPDLVERLRTDASRAQQARFENLLWRRPREATLDYPALADERA